MLERLKGFLSLQSDVNQWSEGDKIKDGIVSELTPELTVDTPDSELISLSKAWKTSWNGYYGTKLRGKQTEAEKYWLGKHPHNFLYNFEGANHPLVDNRIFQALETFLPQITQKTPEPIVSADNTEEGNEISDKVRKMLLFLSDTLVLKLRIKQAVRYWALYYLGVLKVGWDGIEDEVTVRSIRPQMLILDPNATIDETGNYTGEYIGEYRDDKASDLIERFPEKESFIKDVVKDKLGTRVRYIEWWSDYGKILWWELKGEVLGKVRNPHWNYEDTQVEVDDYGEEREVSFTPHNHFKVPQFPYAFLSVFNLGLHPHDETSLIEQNLGNQDLITKRMRQIDENADSLNGGWVISGQSSGLSQEEAYKAVQSLKDGRGFYTPQGDARTAAAHIQGQSLPTEVFNQLSDARNELLGIFGTAGTTPQGLEEEKTVRGKILRAGSDQSRNGGISEYVEQLADRTFNLCVQMMFVYYTEEHVASVIGRENAFEAVALSNSDLDRKLQVSVKSGSMIPKDPLTQANQAIDLFSAGAISPIELHSRLDDPNPRETVKELIEYTTNPQGLFPELQQPQAVLPEGQAPQTQLTDQPTQTEADLLSAVPTQ